MITSKYTHVARGRPCCPRCGNNGRNASSTFSSRHQSRSCCSSFAHSHPPTHILSPYIRFLNSLRLSIPHTDCTMPTSTRPAHVSNARKAARRSRRLRSSARRLNQQPSAAPPNRRPAKRRRLRDQESMNLQECLYDCQDQGYHLDQDVRVGHGVSLNGSGPPGLMFTPF